MSPSLFSTVSDVKILQWGPLLASRAKSYSQGGRGDASPAFCKFSFGWRRQWTKGPKATRVLRALTSTRYLRGHRQIIPRAQTMRPQFDQVNKNKNKAEQNRTKWVSLSRENSKCEVSWLVAGRGDRILDTFLNCLSVQQQCGMWYHWDLVTYNSKTTKSK